MNIQKLKNYLETITNVPPTEWAHFLTLLKIQQFKKNHHLFNKGENGENMYFVLSGVVATFYTDSAGKVAYKDFVTDGRPVASYSAMLMGQPNYFSAVTLSNTWVVTIKYSDFTKLFSRHVCWQKMGRRAVEKVYIERERREYELLMLNSLQRYAAFCEKFDHVKDIIPQWMIASYIGVTHTTLSRLLSNSEKIEPGENPFVTTPQ